VCITGALFSVNALISVNAEIKRPAEGKVNGFQMVSRVEMVGSLAVAQGLTRPPMQPVWKGMALQGHSATNRPIAAASRAEGAPG
jgi:hypothetical protein